jgi:NAD+ diphosphatase
MRQDFKYCPYCRSGLEPDERGGKIRLCCPQSRCGYVHWDNPVPVVAAIVQVANDVILVRSHGWPDTWFGLVAGFVESEESTDQAVLREVAEETGIVTDTATFLGSYPFTLRNQILFVYHIECEAAEIVLDKEELAAFKRVPIEDLVPWTRGTGIAVRDWLASLGYTREAVEFGHHIKQRR